MGLAGLLASADFPPRVYHAGSRPHQPVRSATSRTPRVVLFVADLLHPVDGLAVEFLLDGDVRHRAFWRGAVPMLLSWRKRDHIPGMNLFDRTSIALHEAATIRHNERLTQWMVVPSRAGARLGRALRPLRAARSVCLEQRLDAHLAGEPLPRSLAPRSRTVSPVVHVRLLPC